MNTESPTDDPQPPGPPGLLVEVNDTQSHLRIDPEAVALLARSVLAAEGVRRASVSVVFVDDDTIQGINRRHLAHDRPTDVITFRLSDPDDPVLSGEVVVSAEMAAATAGRAGVDAWHELALYVVHGLLHLCGYDDAGPDDRDAMRRREAEALASQGLTNTFHAADAPGPESEPGTGTDAGAESPGPSAGWREGVRCPT